MLFDEVDSGIGGVILQQVGSRIRELASKQQILLITHWPQLAALGKLHFKVEKEVIDQETYTRCSTLTPEAHIKELARMAGGGDQGMVIARQLVDQHMAQAKEG